MKRLVSWLAVEARGRKVAVFIFIFLVFNIVYSFSVLEFYDFLGVEFPMPDALKQVRNGKIVNIPWYFPGALLSTFLGAAWEELIFRSPLLLAVFWWNRSGKILLAAAALSLVFGLAHGSYHHIFIQGVTGFCLSLLFLKCGGLNEKLNKPILICSSAHALLNIIIFALASFGSQPS